MTKTTSTLAMLVVLVAAFFAVPELRTEARPSRQAQEHESYVVPGGFLVELADGHLALFEVALALTPETAARIKTAGEGQKPVALADGAVATPTEARMRTVISDVITGQPIGHLRSRAIRERLERRIERQLARRVGVPAAELLFTDLTVR